MSRTAEQREADEALTAAIERARAAYFTTTTEQILTDYVVVLAMQGFDDDGEPSTTTGQLVRDSNLPGYRVTGLLHQALNDTGCGCDEEEE